MPFIDHDLPKNGEFKRWKKVSFDDIDYSDPVQLRAAQVSELQHQWVKQYALRVVRDALKLCYETRGVNANEDCKDLALKYLEMLPTHRLKGYAGIQRNDPSK
ncbi:hypothetical protein POJ06DRAFT_260457 [Lipomyces tetrasporus]|uniref:NADH-ubiquinone oxidoreductase 12 kDa subunit n=1 Tax=Lipomyces tetrasporus TaxID=54092 RepID=A0AAD7VQT0_9ASCO|nr:uncharacterized protein POJ06DRAFT_260457 [Lipomyces tetrasporus]KAJ8097914.1 hypothetical protein POJ06DRAFT_260457 [Lipomyces tetrasporus]